MTKNASATPENTPKEINIDTCAKQAGRLSHIGGSQNDDFNNRIANQTFDTLWMGDKGRADAETQKRFHAMVFGLVGIAPKDELEGMLAAQLLACHNASMECYRRAMIPEQSFGGRQEALNQANKLSRTYTTLLESLNRHRGKGQQKVTVEHVHVHAGGQAIVGNVEGGRQMAPGGAGKTEEQHNAKQITDARQPSLSGENQTHKAPVPVSRD